jgi:hypothetical protein
MGLGIVDVWKVGEQGDLITYAYAHEGQGGEFTINRTTGEIAASKLGPGRAGYAAQHKIIKAWRQGLLPDRTQWAG